MTGFCILSKNKSFIENKISDYNMHNIIAIKSKNDPIIIESNKVYNYEDLDINQTSEIESYSGNNTVMILQDYWRYAKRLDKRNIFLKNFKCYKKIITGIIPFYVDIWKYYFNFFMFDKSLIGYAHSYALESDYNHYLNGDININPCDPIMLAEKTKDYVFIDFKNTFDYLLKEEIIVTSDSQKVEYKKLKDHLFESETSIDRIMRSLYKYTSSLIKGYNLPWDFKKIYYFSGNGLFNDYTIIRTDLGIDNYLFNEIKRIYNYSNILTNKLFEASYE